MTEQTTEKLAGKLDLLRAGAWRDDVEPWLALADYFEQLETELRGRLEHVDDMQHKVLRNVSVLLDELERFRPLLNMLRPAGAAPDFISVGQGLRNARKMRRGG